ncbi:MFS transporter, DHA1 family, bicyclomycin/chloramphenicol resistance protein [Rhizobium sp. RU35A]|uniref:Bcr/CflA family efflux transporter n=1 Tax=Rhizobium straminoryzae TaxID=1387186 RepID=A0A549T218_9HYPH|nr:MULTISPECIES: multidrug effflux MFS transporter [Rhizobium]TRL35913.1 multidrug effflux MFS transporter [Rhizobium straminoryzae]SIQ18329.1 MFS transporter, DHA1 family, bicyclomycin/chloramphenicol resistance protein [Rhizobium sp. RU35A]
MQTHNRALAIALGAICALGPFATDMYVAAMPRMAEDLASTPSHIQLSMMTYFIGFTIGQLFYGPVSDRTGRKPMIYLALTIFVMASIGCLLSATSGQLLGFRFLQGIGGSIGMVIATASIRDVHTGQAAAKLMSAVVLVLSIAPVLAPLAGGLILQGSSWRIIFAALAGLGLLVAVITAAMLPETRMAELRAASRPSAALHWYARLLVTRSFIPYAGALALAQGGFFAYIAGSSFVLINVYGLSPLAYAVIFSLNAVGIGIGTQVSAKLATQIGIRAMVKVSASVSAAAGLLLLMLQLAGLSGLVSTCVLVFVMVMAVGGIMPSCNVLAMEAHGAIAGTAAALMGALGFGAGALGSFAIGILDDGTALPLIMVMTVCAVATALVAVLTFGRAGHLQRAAA